MDDGGWQGGDARNRGSKRPRRRILVDGANRIFGLSCQKALVDEEVKIKAVMVIHNRHGRAVSRARRVVYHLVQIGEVFGRKIVVDGGRQQIRGVIDLDLLFLGELFGKRLGEIGDFITDGVDGNRHRRGDGDLHFPDVLREAIARSENQGDADDAERASDSRKGGTPLLRADVAGGGA